MPLQPNVLVVGSINMDLVVRSPRMPAPGETILGDQFKTNPGGKGANQAVAAARLGGHCTLLGRLGDDDFGETLLGGLKNEGVDCEHVIATSGAATGVAFIIVDGKGENSIVVASGANYLVTPDDVFSNEQLFVDAEVVLLQLELPLPTVRASIDLARRHGCKIILDPAPAPRQMPPELYQVDIISPNAAEAEILVAQAPALADRVDKHVASDLIARGARCAVLKLGPRGSLVVTADGHFYTVPAYKVTVIDTTAAGDAFTAALAVAVGRGDKIHEAARFANAAGALACSRMGAQSAMPTLAEVQKLMQQQPA